MSQKIDGKVVKIYKVKYERRDTVGHIKTTYRGQRLYGQRNRDYIKLGKI